MALRDLGEEMAEVGGHREVAPLEELLAAEARPAPVHLAAAHRPAQHQHGGGVAVIRAPVAVLPDGAPELRHGEHDHVGHAVAQIAVQRGQPLGEVGEPVGELPSLGALGGVSVPAAGVRERDLQPHVGPDELGDLPQALAEAPARDTARRWRGPGPAGSALRSIFTASKVSRPVPWRRSRTPLSYMDSKPRRAFTAPGIAGPASDFTSKSAMLLIATAPASPRSTRGSREPMATARNGDAPGRGVAWSPRASQPSGGALHAGRSRFHVVLRVEVRARGVGRAAGVDHGEPARVPQRLERRQRRVQAEEAVEVERGLGARPRRAARWRCRRAPHSSRGRRGAPPC